MRAKSHLTKAKNNKKDEFYTQLSDIENELKHYKEYFKDKVVYCNCDDYRKSNFVKYFVDNFNTLGLKQINATCFDNGDGAYLYRYDGENATETILKGNGDFRSDECVDLLKQCDAVVTNPPFSLFKDFVAQLFKYDKKFLVIGNQCSIGYVSIFPLIKENKMSVVPSKDLSKWFEVPQHYTSESGAGYKEENGKRYLYVGGTVWYTNIPNDKSIQPLKFCKKYNSKDYQMYDNYCAFNVNKVKDIPMDDYIEVDINPNDLDKWKKAYGKDIEIIGEG